MAKELGEDILQLNVGDNFFEPSDRNAAQPLRVVSGELLARIVIENGSPKLGGPTHATTLEILEGSRAEVRRIGRGTGTPFTFPNTRRGDSRTIFASQENARPLKEERVMAVPLFK